MSLSLPLMNNLCKRWTLPEHIKKDCDFYFLRSYSDQELVQILRAFPDETGLYIQEYGINFTVIFQHGADKVYIRNGELAKRNEPNNTSYWCSFRSITFEWQGVACTKSYVLVQVDKGVKDFKTLTRERAEGTPREPLQKETTETVLVLPEHELAYRSRKLEFNPNLAAPYGIHPVKSFNSYVELSQPRERDSLGTEIDEEV